MSFALALDDKVDCFWELGVEVGEGGVSGEVEGLIVGVDVGSRLGDALMVLRWIGLFLLSCLNSRAQ